MSPGNGLSDPVKLTVAGLSHVVDDRDGGRRAILDDVSFSAPAGRFFTIVGLRGAACGRSRAARPTPDHRASLKNHRKVPLAQTLQGIVRATHRRETGR